MWQMIFQIVPIIAWGVSILVVVRPLKLSRLSSLVAVALLGIAFGKFAFFELVGGNGFTPNLPQSVIWTYGCVYGTAMFLTMLSFASVLLDGVVGRVWRPIPVRLKRVRIVMLAFCAAALSLWGIWEGVRIPSVRRIELSCHGLPSSFDGYRIVHLSDLHCSSAALRERFEKIVARVNELKPDLVAITGDFVDGCVASRGDDLSPLANLRAKNGVVGCTGNHEAYWEWDRWRIALQEMGIVFPEESGVYIVRRGDDALAVGGLVDPVFRPSLDDIIDWGLAYRAFIDAPIGAFRILLFHRPITDKVDCVGADVRLQLSGHTHGGAMPILRTLVELTNEGRSGGLYEFGPGRFLHLSQGTGQWAGFPLRFVPSVITELTLRKAD